MSSFSLSSALRFAWESFRTRPLVYVSVILITEALWYLVRFLQVQLHSVFGLTLATDLVSMVIFIVVSGGVFIALTNFALRAHDAPKEVTVKDAFNFRSALPLGVLFLLGGMLFLVGIRLWVLPGLFFLVFFIYAPYIASEKGSMPYYALKEAGTLALSKIPQLFVLIMLSISGSILYLLLVLFFNLSEGIANIASVIVDVVAMPVGFLSIVHAYRSEVSK